MDNTPESGSDHDGDYSTQESDDDANFLAALPADLTPDDTSLITLPKNAKVKLMQPVDLADVKTKHPLWCRWALWYDSTSKKTTRKNWSDNLKEVHSFDTGEDFWSVYNNIHSPSQLGHGSNYHLFKHGIKPMWEHEANKRGGKWIIHINRRYKDKLDTAWLYLSMALIGENFKEGDEICGGVVSVRKNGDRISLWTRSARESEVCRHIGVQFRELLSAVIPEMKLVYQAHSDSLQNDSSFGNQPLYQLYHPANKDDSIVATSPSTGSSSNSGALSSSMGSVGGLGVGLNAVGGKVQ
eukprot:TRINITY_DN67610_c10_g3_i1.p1 TRINITY_DN67610_c10_g3~~TRINITY_DN67610_c10_g3_i1.p1  ORF type:complete len:342 (+),score=37.02 TRINITY_DN67610_c10_g3_i1:137-1027(+)